MDAPRQKAVSRVARDWTSLSKANTFLHENDLAQQRDSGFQQ